MTDASHALTRAARALAASLILVLAAPMTATAQVPIEPMPIDPIPPCPWWSCRGPADVVVEDYRVEAIIDNGIATTKVTQVVRNDSDFIGEGTFLHPIPTDAAVTGLTLWIDGEPVSGELLDGEAARRTYEDIVRRTLDPALLEYAGDGLLRLSVFPIAAHDTRRVEIEYRQVLPADGGLVRYRHPLGREHGATIERISARIEIRDEDGVKTVYSPSHPISVDRLTDRVAVVGFESDGVGDGDFTLYHSTGDAPIGLEVLSYRQDGEGYFLLLASPGLPASTEVVPKDVVVVLDVSGSMEGEKLDQAQAAAGHVLAHLNERDRFEVIAFSTGVDSYGDGLRNAAEAGTAATWVDMLAAGGATDIDRALTTAFDRAESGRPTYVIFLTDGLPTEGVVDTADILSRLESRRSETTSVFVFGVGYDVDTVLLDAIARDHHGTSAYVVPGEAIDAAIEAWYAKVASPVLTGVTLSVDGVTVSDLHPRPLPDVFRGGQLVLSGRYDGAGPATITLRGRVDGETTEFSFPDVAFAAEGGDPAIPRLWATRKIGELLRTVRIDGPDEETIDQIVRLSIRWGIVTPYTSYLVAGDAPIGADAIEEASRSAARDAAAAPLPASGEMAVGAADAASDLVDADTGGSVATEYAALVRIGGGRTFRFVDGVWIDTRFDPGTATVRIAFGSPDYFALAASDGALRSAMAVAPRMIVVAGDVAYEIVADGEAVDPLPETVATTTVAGTTTMVIAADPGEETGGGSGFPVAILAISAAVAAAGALTWGALRRGGNTA